MLDDRSHHGSGLLLQPNDVDLESLENEGGVGLVERKLADIGNDRVPGSRGHVSLARRDRPEEEVLEPLDDPPLLPEHLRLLRITVEPPVVGR